MTRRAWGFGLLLAAAFWTLVVLLAVWLLAIPVAVPEVLR